MSSSNIVPWLALKVRVRCEARVDAMLQQKGYECFTPTFIDHRCYSDRVKRIESALFPGYVFCRFVPTEPLPILTTPAVYEILSIGAQPAVISDSEIDKLRRTAATGKARPCPYLEIGQRVRVRFGALAGVEGILTQYKGTQRLVIAAELLQRAVAVEVDLDHVVPA